MSNTVSDKVARFETLVRLLNWENGLFVAIICLGYAVSATRALSTASAISRSSVAMLAAASGALLLNMTRYRLKTDNNCVLSLLVNARISESVFSLGLAALIGAGQWATPFFLARGDGKRSLLTAIKGLYNNAILR